MTLLYRIGLFIFCFSSILSLISLLDDKNLIKKKKKKKKIISRFREREEYLEDFNDLKLDIMSGIKPYKLFFKKIIKIYF